MKEIIAAVDTHVRSLFSDEATGHDWYHIDRVRNNALKIQKLEGGNADIVELGALLHDISDYKFNGGDAQKGGQVAHDLLSELGASPQLATTIQIIVDSISFKGANVADTTNSLEAKIIQDADRLDAVGAIGIGRTFAYGGHVGNPMYDPNIPHQLHDSFEAYKTSKSTTINHFYEKLLLLADRMHTETARIEARKRIAIMEDFLTQFYKEWNSNF